MREAQKLPQKSVSTAPATRPGGVARAIAALHAAVPGQTQASAQERQRRIVTEDWSRV